MSARGWGSKADLEAEIEELEERERELVTALDEIHDLLANVNATTVTDPLLEEIREWTDQR